MGICGGGGGCILPLCDSFFIAVTSSVKPFLQLHQIDINFHGFKDEEADFYLWQQRQEAAPKAIQKNQPIKKRIGKASLCSLGKSRRMRGRCFQIKSKKRYKALESRVGGKSVRGVILLR